MADQESRTAAVGRKRKNKRKWPQVSAPADKRPRWLSYDGDRSDQGPHGSEGAAAAFRRGSRESGEISTSASSRRASHDSSAEPGPTKPPALAPEHATAEPVPAKPPARAPEPSTAVVSASDGGKASRKAQSRMPLFAIEHADFRSHVYNQPANDRSASVEDFVRLCGQSSDPNFSQIARQAIQRWDDHVADMRRRGAAPLLPSRAAGLSARQLAEIISHGRFYRDMTIADLTEAGGRPLRRHVERKRTPESGSIPEVLLGVVQEGREFNRQARKCLNEYIDKYYVLDLTPGGQSAGPQQTPQGAEAAHDRFDAADGPPTAPSAMRAGEAPRPVSASDEDKDDSEDDNDDESSVMSISSSDSESESSGDAASVGEVPPKQNHHHGPLTRAMARSGHGHDTSVAPPAIRLPDIFDDEQELQSRYFLVGVPGAPNVGPRCLSCGGEGHMAYRCPDITCKHCGARNQHFSSACPAFRKCSLCRQRGHDALHCANRAIPGGGPGDPCDVCGELGHVEEECAQLWRSFRIADQDIRKVDHLTKACYNCGRGDHWGDDCPTLPSFLRSKRGSNNTWSAAYADRFVTHKTPTVYSGMATLAAGHEHQLAQLSDMRD